MWISPADLMFYNWIDDLVIVYKNKYIKNKYK